MKGEGYIEHLHGRNVKIAKRCARKNHVEDCGALDLIRHYEPFVDAFLRDSGRPGAAVAQLGGTGRPHNWQISVDVVRCTHRPVYLAGGLSSDNVAQAIRVVV